MLKSLAIFPYAEEPKRALERFHGPYFFSNEDLNKATSFSINFNCDLKLM